MIMFWDLASIDTFQFVLPVLSSRSSQGSDTFVSESVRRVPEPQRRSPGVSGACPMGLWLLTRLFIKHYPDAILLKPSEVSTMRKVNLEGFGDLSKVTRLIHGEAEFHSALSACETLAGCAGAESGVGPPICLIHCSVGSKPFVCTSHGLADLCCCSQETVLLYGMCGNPEQTSGGQPNSNHPPEKQIRGSLETKNMIITPSCPRSPLLSPQAKRRN